MIIYLATCAVVWLTPYFLGFNELSIRQTIFDIWPHHVCVWTPGANLFSLCISQDWPFTSPPHWCSSGLVFFAFAWMWPQLSLPKFTKSIATVSLYLSLWANWVGTLFVGIFGAGREQYIVNQDLVPGAKGFWNLATLLLINLSQLAVLAVVLAIIGFLGWAWTAKKERVTNVISALLFIVLILISLFQIFNPEFSNG